MIRLRFIHILTLVALLLSASSCNLPTNLLPASPGNRPAAGSSQAAGQPLSTPLPPAPQTLINFRVLAPANTPPGGLVYLTLVDEVTGLALNPHPIPMEPLPQTEANAPFAYILTLPASIGSVLTYRYERDLGGVRVAEHISDGTPVRYRMYHVTGQGLVEDVISRWTDTAYTATSGRIVGQAREAGSQAPLPGLLLEAGGMQTFSASDGSFRLEGLPPGTHNLVAYAPDGRFQTFQQGARVAADSTTPATIEMKPAAPVSIVFVVRAPAGTPPVVPLRLAGNLFNLGNSYGDLAGGQSSVVGNMPVMKNLPDGRYTLTLNLPAGADIRYKYTLGDGFWNAEHAEGGAFRLRQLIVPDHTILVEDAIDTWFAGEPNSITFDVQVPAGTPAEDFVSIQFNPLIGWNQPLPMWPLGNGRWAYMLLSPLNLPGSLGYRYCRSSQCELADEAQASNSQETHRSLQIASAPKTQSDRVSAWKYWANGPAAVASLPAVEAQARGDTFAAGVELPHTYQPSWRAQLPGSFKNIQSLGANWLVLGPTWSYGRMGSATSETTPNASPILAPVAGQDALWPELVQTIQQARSAGLAVALFPTPRFSIPAEEWWLTADRANPGWWPVWFDQYRTFVLHHADLAAQNDAGALILGGDWLSPALPEGTLANGQPSGVPDDAEKRWRGLIAEVRSRYSGKLLWSLSDQTILNPPVFLDTLDQVYLTLSPAPDQTYEDLLGMTLEAWLEGVAWPVQLSIQKPFSLAVQLPSGANLQTQVDLYQEALQAASQRDWITGFISRGYDPVVRLQDPTATIHGKPAEELLKLWFSQLRRTP